MTQDDEMNASKRAYLNACLAVNDRRLVGVDPRMCTVPPKHRDEPSLFLHVGHNMPVPIKDLQITAAGISGVFSFARSPYYCHIPWRAVFWIGDDEGYGSRWVGHEPPELRSALEVAHEAHKAVRGEETVPRAPAPPKPAEAPRRPSREVIENRMRARGLRVIAGGAS